MRMRASKEGSCDPIAPLELPYAMHAFHRVSSTDKLNLSNGELQGAEEYFLRATQADPNDGEILMQYAKLVLEQHHDIDRALVYFERAAQATPQDSNVLAAYASFLRETEDDENKGGKHETQVLLTTANCSEDSDAADYFQKMIDENLDNPLFLKKYAQFLFQYEDVRCQEAAQKTVPVDELEEKALVSLAKEGNFKPSKIEQDYAFLLQLLFWFKQSSRWVNSPSYHDCGNKTENWVMTAPLPSEALYRADTVELYRCTFCSKLTHFPQYNDPMKVFNLCQIVNIIIYVLGNYQTNYYAYHIYVGYFLYSLSICNLWKQERAAVWNGPIALHSIVELLAMSHVWFVTG